MRVRKTPRRYYTVAYVFAAIEPLTGRDFCLVLQAVSTVAMSAFLQRFSQVLDAYEHAVMVIDGAGSHTSHDLVVPHNVTLLRLPPYSPELNPVERVWLSRRQWHLSHRVNDDCPAIFDAVCHAWRQLTPERLRSLCQYPWLAQVKI